MLKEFREFAIKGNMVDLAVGVIIGAAFGAVVKSVVDDVFMPVVSGVLRLPDFTNLFIMLRNPAGAAFASVKAARDAGAVVLAIGLFINACVAFLGVALVLFLVLRLVTRRGRCEGPARPPPAPPSAGERLLAEIRALLASRPR